MPAQRKQPVFGGAGQMMIGQRALVTRCFREGLDRKARVKGQCVQIRILIDDARSDQHLISTDPELPAARFGRAQQRGREHLSQAIQFARRARFRVAQPVVVAGLREVANAGGKGRRRERPTLRYGAVLRGGPSAILDTTQPRQSVAPNATNDTRVPLRMVL